MEFIEGFAWPVPRALGGAVSTCRFEQGDVLYSDARAYTAWPGGRENLAHALQVLDPPKTARALAGEAVGNRFAANWDSPVEVEIADRSVGRTDRLKTTQGRLFACLWHGDPGRLDLGWESPPPPAAQRELHPRLEEAVPAFVEAFGGSPEAGEPALCLYLSAVDDASDAARTKARAVEATLAGRFATRTRVLAPGQAGLGGTQVLHPALRIWAIAVAGATPATIEADLRGLLYGGGGESGRFALARHGLLVEIGPG